MFSYRLRWVLVPRSSCLIGLEVLGPLAFVASGPNHFMVDSLRRFLVGGNWRFFVAWPKDKKCPITIDLGHIMSYLLICKDRIEI